MLQSSEAVTSFSLSKPESSTPLPVISPRSVKGRQTVFKWLISGIKDPPCKGKLSLSPKTVGHVVAADLVTDFE